MSGTPVTETPRAHRPAALVRTIAARCPKSLRDPYLWLIAALAFGLGSVFVAVDLGYNQGHLVAPLDDVYIHLQYGRQLGDGHPFEYNTGDDVSTGASSLLYAFVLGTAYAIGFTGGKFLAFAVLLGVTCFAVTAALTYRLGRVLLSRTVGIWAGVLVACSGPLLWGAASGMEVGLTAMLVVGALLCFTEERTAFRDGRPNRFVLTPVVALLLALVRPEGLILAVLLCGAMLWTLLAPAGRLRRPPRPVLPWAALALLPLAAAVGQYTFYRVATGTFRANGVQSKSYLYDRPVFFAGDFVDRTMANVRGVVSNLGGFENMDFAFPGALFVALTGLAYLLAAQPIWRPLLIALTVALVLVTLTVSTLSSALVHEMRYFQPFLPILILLTVCGVHGLTRLIPDERARHVGLSTLLVVVLLFSLVTVPSWALRLGRESAAIRDTDVSVGAWINGNLPPEAIVGVKDVGAVAYFGNRRIVDTIGLATNGFAEPANDGTGALYEKLRAMPPDERPTHFAVYESSPGAPMQGFVDAGVFDEPLIVFPRLVPPDVNGNFIVPFDELGVYPADWSLAGTGDRAPIPGRVRDYINVGDLEAEDDHDYVPEMSQAGLQPYSVLRRQQDVVDSGRIIVGGEEFTVHGLDAGAPLTIAARVLAGGNLPEVRVLVDGTDVGLWRFEPGTAWSTQTFEVPASAVRSGSLEIELKPAGPLLSPYPEYTSFGYWFVQP